MAAADIAQLSARFEALVTEHQISKQKLESKCEALLILSRELADCRSERDQFKLMAEQLRERYQVLKRQLAGHRPMSPSHDDSSSSVDLKEYATAQGQGLAQVLIEYREQNKSLQFTVDDLKQKLQDANGDIKLLREQIVRSRVGTTDEGMTTRHFPAYEREDLVQQLEASREQVVQLERDLQQVIDEKQELVSERDAYRHKYGRLNTELNYILKGDEKGVVDIDAIIMENKYLHERLKQMEEEKGLAMDTVSKYKSILEKKKNKGILKVGQNRSERLILSQKQVQQMLQNKSIAPSTQALTDLQALCSALLDSANDKSLALSHQRKANKILGNRVAELEKKLKTLEVTGLWTVSAEHMNNLQKLRQECIEVKAMVPVPASESSETSDQPRDLLSDLDSDSLPQTPSTGPSPTHHARRLQGQGDLADLDLLSSGPRGHDMEADLDLLPTKEEVMKHIGDGDGLGQRDRSFRLTDLHLPSAYSDEPDDHDRAPTNDAYHDTHDVDNDNDAEDDDDSDTNQAEKSSLLGKSAAANEDHETARKLQTFMESVTSKILERNHSGRTTGPVPISGSGDSVSTSHCRDVRIPSSGSDSKGPGSPGALSDLLLRSSPTKQPLLQEMSEPAEEQELGEKSVPC